MTSRLLPLVVPLILMAGCEQDKHSAYQGYIEGEEIRVATSQAGRLVARKVERGTQVKTGDLLFVLEQDNETAAAREAQSRLAQSRAQAENLTKGKRSQEIAVIQSQITQANAQLKLSEAQLSRITRLRREDVVSEAELDDARTSRDRDAARVKELTAQLATARLAAREDEIQASRAQVAAAEAALSQAQWRLEQKVVNAPAGGQVLDTLYEIGEWVPAGAPVITLLQPDHVKARFYVPEPELGRIRLGDPVTVQCDGCAKPYAAKINFIAPQAEFTPPVIYSKESRSKLVFLVEARLEAADAAQLHPGQPVDVEPQP